MLKIIVGKNEEKYKNDELLEIMRRLRAPDGCPWDIEQTHKSIRKDLLEEAYEVADAIDKDDNVALCEELGDLLLQVVFHSAIAEEEGSFDYSDVVDGICKKLVLRHPHVFGNAKAENSSEVLDLWDNVKMEEKHQTNFTETLRSVPSAFPALMRSAKVQKRALKSGISPNENADNDLKTLTERFLSAIEQEDKQLSTEMYGKLLFSLAGFGQTLKVDAEETLNRETDRFIERFEEAENKMQKH